MLKHLRKWWWDNRHEEQWAMAEITVVIAIVFVLHLLGVI